MLNNDVESHRLQLGQCQKQFRDSNLKCILEIQNKDRDELFKRASDDLEGGDNTGSGSGGMRQRKKNKDRDALISDSGQVSSPLLN